MRERAFLLIRCLLGGTFLLAGALKVGSTPDFLLAMEKYRILPGIYLGLAAAITPWLEIVPALTLIAGVWQQSSAILLGTLSLIFSVAVASVLWRHIDIACGCFHGATHVSYWHLALNLALLAMAVAVARKREPI